MDVSGMKIKILKNGPYIVSGNVPLLEKIIVPEGQGYKWKEGRTLPQAEKYALCRCGKSKCAPFCDGMHEKIRFIGKEDASKALYEDRAEVMEGPDLDLLDDHRCSFSRFCHRNAGDVWELTMNSHDPYLKTEAVKAATSCPAGRLVVRSKTGEIIEPVYEPSIVIIQDPERNVSGGIFVKGNIPIESPDGQIYEIRNRVVLCRCGHSHNMPFCDAMHVSIGYSD